MTIGTRIIFILLLILLIIANITIGFIIGYRCGYYDRGLEHKTTRKSGRHVRTTEETEEYVKKSLDRKLP